MTMSTIDYDEPNYDQSQIMDENGLGLLQEDTLYVEWLQFLYGIWKRIDYL